MESIGDEESFNHEKKGADIHDKIGWNEKYKSYKLWHC